MCVMTSFIGLTTLAYANHHEAGESNAHEKCAGMAEGSFSISGLDANKDGSISKAEYLSGDPSNTEKVFKHIDANSDGSLNQTEQADVEAVYKAIHQPSKPKNTSI